MIGAFHDSECRMTRQMQGPQVISFEFPGFGVLGLKDLQFISRSETPTGAPQQVYNT